MEFYDSIVSHSLDATNQSLPQTISPFSALKNWANGYYANLKTQNVYCGRTSVVVFGIHRMLSKSQLTCKRFIKDTSVLGKLNHFAADVSLMGSKASWDMLGRKLLYGLHHWTKCIFYCNYVWTSKAIIVCLVKWMQILHSLEGVAREWKGPNGLKRGLSITYNVSVFVESSYFECVKPNLRIDVRRGIGHVGLFSEPHS